MSKEQRRSILIIDDNRDFAEPLKLLLEREGYDVSLAFSVDDGITLLEHSVNPMFVMADRILEDGEPIEIRELESLSEASGDSYIVIYTTISEPTDEQIFNIMSKGAVRVIKREEVEGFVANIKLLTREFDELIEISSELQKITSERSKLVAALVGLDVGLTVIDRYFYCWFANDAQERIVGKPYSGNLCWKLFHHHPVSSGPCWGCPVKELLASSKPVERRFLSRFADGSVKWVSERFTPIRDSETKEVIAVREGVTEVKDTIVRGLSLDQRLQKIAEGLIHSGFGRARIYRALGDGHIELCAAAARTDDPKETQSKYRQSLGTLSLLYEECPYITRARDSKFGLFIPEWNTRDAPSPFAYILDLEPPYFVVPVFYDHVRLCGFLCVDFVNVEEGLREVMLRRYAKEDTLDWLQRDYAREVKEAFEAAEDQSAQRKFYEAVQRAEIGIGAARSVDDAISELRSALSALVPKCRVSVRISTDEGLKEYEKVCIGPREEEPPEVIGFDNSRSLAIQAVKVKHPLWIDDYQEYQKRAKREGIPLGYPDPEIESCAQIPLMFESKVFGSLSIDSWDPISWEAHGYIRPLLELSNLAALVVRDIALQEDLEQRSADLAAMTAYSITVSGDAMWKHWASQRLAEASMAVYECELILRQDGSKNELLEVLQSLKRDIQALKEGRPPDQAAGVCSLDSVLSALDDRFQESTVKLISKLPKSVPKVKAPRFHVRHILQILTDNAVESIRSSGIGKEVRITVRKVGRRFVETEVCDDGPGIPEGLKERLLREPIESEDAHGTGLLIARGTALQDGGDLFQRETNTGACFVLKLPAARAGK
jgi:CheY-like chemotaxis protein